MNAERNAKSRSDARFGIFALLDATLPPVLRLWHRLMVGLFVVIAVGLVATLFGLVPESLKPLRGAIGLIAMLLLAAGWAYRARLRPEYGFRSIFRLSRHRAIFANAATVVSVLGIGLMQVTEGTANRAVAIFSLISLVVAILVIATQPRRSAAAQAETGDDR